MLPVVTCYRYNGDDEEETGLSDTVAEAGATPGREEDRISRGRQELERRKRGARVASGRNIRRLAIIILSRRSINLLTRASQPRFRTVQWATRRSETKCLTLPREFDRHARLHRRFLLPRHFSPVANNSSAVKLSVHPASLR